ncbi:MAG: hypothetical protein B5M49_01005 [Thermotoga sp. 4484_232]|nr:DUF89 family protein [Thermotogaceae bacterium]OQX58859.1 MAG: hypothetical protein B5M49_01005 [Thermotoga sp. 4484_232]RKX40285.1 MAG: DUF89 domain-containing protein [Thermotogota bacterium]RKX52810.1 MAG: DUF89 domain-containing protein [Thermotoga sp.]RKX56447.1 MAG: DUF89 domain-containing protein [Thermotoga sp.]
MRADARCLICTLNQAMRVLSKYEKSHHKKWQRIQEIMKKLSEMEWGLKPLEIGGRVHTYLKKVLNAKDPYIEEKKRSNEMAERILEELKPMIRSSADPLYDASKLAAAGNLIDLGLPDWNEKRAFERIKEILSKPFGKEDFERFKESIKNAFSLLYVLDNSGEVVFDRFFIEIMKEYNPSLEVTVAAKASPVINDVTVEDALSVGMDKVANIISSGMELPGTMLDFSNEGFRKHFFESDIVLSKGQGNFEGLVDEDRKNLFFLLVVKCDVVAEFLNVPVESLVFVSRDSLE